MWRAASIAALVTFAAGCASRSPQPPPAAAAATAPRPPGPGGERRTLSVLRRRSASPAVARPGNGIGVPECDAYLAVYLRCIAAKVPAAARASLMEALVQTRAAWRASAGTPQGRAALAHACTRARQAAAGAIAAWGCQ
jgi:hypothetical protein